MRVLRRRRGLSGCLTVIVVTSAICAAALGAAGAHARLSVVISGRGTVHVGPAHRTCTHTCSLTVTPGTRVTLTAHPTGADRFVGWSGACSGTGPCRLTMRAPERVTARFRRTFGLAVSAIGPGAGSITSSPRGIACRTRCSARFVIGTRVAVHATARAGSRFTGFLGSCRGAACAAVMSGNRVVRVRFARTLGRPRLVLAAAPGRLRIGPFRAVAHASGYRYRLCNYAGINCGAALRVSAAGATVHGLAGGAMYTVDLAATGDGAFYVDSPAIARRATVPAIVLAPPTSSNAGCAATTIAQENAKPGGTGWQPPATIGPPLVQGFAQYTSAACGGSLGLYLGTHSARPVSVHLEVWRLGYYRGAGGRLVWTSPTLAVAAAPVWAHVNPATDEVTAPWPRTATLAVPHAWTQGIYELRIVPVGNPSAAGAIPLVIRDDTRTTPMVQVLATNTDQMYSQWGGHSAYSTATGISTVVSLDRPYDGFGMAQILEEEYPLARFAESQGRQISYLTDGDLDHGSPELAAATALVVGSHSEYWTPRMRANFEAALARGANAAFFGANSIYWRPVPVSSTGRYSALDIWKLNPKDPNAASPTLASTMWRLSPINDPEQKILGEQFGCTDVLMPMTVPASLGWVFAGTGATPGQQLQGVIYQETDTPTTGAPMPAGTRLVSAMTFPCPQRSTGFASGSAFALTPQAGGGLVVNVGTRGWVCLLDGSCVTNPVYSDASLLAVDPDIVTTTVRNDPTVEAVIRGATTNILNALLGGPAARDAGDPSYPLAPGA